MVCFHDNPEKYNNPAMLHNIDQEVNLNCFWNSYQRTLVCNQRAAGRSQCSNSDIECEDCESLFDCFTVFSQILD